MKSILLTLALFASVIRLSAEAAPNADVVLSRTLAVSEAKSVVAAEIDQSTKGVHGAARLDRFEFQHDPASGRSMTRSEKGTGVRLHWEPGKFLRMVLGWPSKTVEAALMPDGAQGLKITATSPKGEVCTMFVDSQTGFLRVVTMSANGAQFARVEIGAYSPHAGASLPSTISVTANDGSVVAQTITYK